MGALYFHTPIFVGETFIDKNWRAIAGTHLDLSRVNTQIILEKSPCASAQGLFQIGVRNLFCLHHHYVPILYYSIL